MSEQDELENTVDRIFRQNRLTSTQSSKSRLRNILKRSLHELAIKDVLRFVGRMVWVMLTLASNLLKIIINPR